ncbi:hypothetical protein LCI18_006959 [Fusarium solani-melongenae]|uniref:Uncharacterized protein n=1 Tax=Fusarium solani subsp. cucurbitae TaxID=2747967 RepID=A0ACD3Z431_FUSSC|nr:hypothetical protein LCI18_006959 [Fusarium solani-melongenae]
MERQTLPSTAAEPDVESDRYSMRFRERERRTFQQRRYPPNPRHSHNQFEGYRTPSRARSKDGRKTREKQSEQPSKLRDTSRETTQEAEGNTSQLASLAQSSSGDHQILYRLTCSERDKMTFRYSWKPFDGLEQDDREKQDRRNLAVLDVIDRIDGDHLSKPPRKSQLRQSFLTDDPFEFKVNVDFRVRNKHHTTIRIHSPHVRKMLQALIRYYPGFNVQERELYLTHPFPQLFHYWDDLQFVLRQGPNGDQEINSDTGPTDGIIYSEMTCKHLQTVLTATPVQRAWDKIVRPELNLYDSGSAAYDFLWLLFKPGDIVFLGTPGDSKNLSGFVVMSITHLSFNKTTSPLINPHPADQWELALWNLAYDNGSLRRRARTVHVNRFYGPRVITELPAFPTRFAPDQEATRSQLIERGKRYYRIICNQQSYMRYNGPVISDKPYPYKGEIIVDHQSYKLEALDCPNLVGPSVLGEEPQDLGGGPLFSKLNGMACSAATELDPEHYLLLPASVLGFALGKREWAVFDMNFVEDLVIDSNPMKYLIMSPEKQEMIEAVAGSPRKGMALKPWTTDWSADFVEGKGRGQVIFLHGKASRSPGTGKTMTVELIAKKTRRPLLSLSVADLGTEEVQMEKRLMKWLSRAAIWGAIVLIDEAEVYMEQREPGQTGRNALVTAFLRSMEYFPGLLFLTSNGIGLFDEAVMSRIHLAVQYERPTDAERTEIWRKLFDKLEQDQESSSESSQSGGSAIKPTIVVRSTARDVVLSKEQYPTNLKLNGRDIRNLLLSAISLARHRSLKEAVDGKPPTNIEVMAKDLEAVLKNKEHFNDHYKEATGSYPDEMAAQKYFRGESKS